MMLRTLTTLCALVFSAAAAGAQGLQDAATTDQQQHDDTQMPPEKGAAYGADAAAYEYGFQSVDRDGDGYISRAEAREHPQLEELWDNIDRDGDERIDASEFSIFEEEPKPR